MAKRPDIDYRVLPAETPNWPDLLSKTVDDLSRIARTEIELLEASLGRLIQAQTSKIVGMLFLLVAVIYGSFFLLGGVFLLLNLWLDWWAAFLITGFIIVSAGVFFQFKMNAVARAKSGR